jgi:dTDP-4-dehydrorhamnose 3,5-epimerase
MKLESTPLDGLWVARTNRVGDDRGSFARQFCATDLQAAFGARSIVQINRSRTRDVGTVRGLHYQLAPHAEMKLIRCLQGRVFDVAVDARPGSPTYLQWHSVELSPETEVMMIIPEGFAHGFQVLEANSDLLYLHTAAYMPEFERGLHPLDPQISISWPLPVDKLSDRDQRHPFVVNDFPG